MTTLDQTGFDREDQVGLRRRNGGCSCSEKSLAQERYHLTATQAGLLARRAQAERFVPFHFSLRYQPEPNRLKEEALAAFAGRAKAD